MTEAPIGMIAFLRAPVAPVAPVMAALVLLGGCARPWLESHCSYATSPAGDALVYHGDGALVLRRADGERRVPFTGCLRAHESMRYVVTLKDGWRAVAVGYESSGGNWIESGRRTLTMGCLVDFRAKTSTPLPFELLGSAAKESVEQIVGRVTGRIYLSPLLDPIRAIDLERPDGTALVEADSAMQRSTDVVLAERDDALVVVRHVYQRRAGTEDAHDHGLWITEYGLDWPPVEHGHALIPVRANVSRLVISDDGEWLAYAEHFDLEYGHEPTFTWGLVQLSTRKIVFESTTWDRAAEPHAIRVRDGKPRVLAKVAREGAEVGERERYAAVWIDEKGNRISPPVGRFEAFVGLRVIPWRRRVVSSGQCALRDVELGVP